LLLRILILSIKIIFAENIVMLPEAMSHFLKKHHVMSLAVSDSKEVWVAHCFYAYDSERNWIVFTSDDETRHVKMMETEKNVSVSVALETRVIGKIQGIQMSGIVWHPVDKEYDKAMIIYLKRFPYAAVMKTSFWIFSPGYAKMTDNALGFGKKLIWLGND
jgi:uncharacterized protein